MQNNTGLKRLSYFVFSASLTSILALGFFQASAQKDVLVNPMFKPNHKYQTTTVTEAKSTINFKGDEDKINQIKASGTQLPVTMLNKTEMKTVTTASAAKADKTTPVSIEYLPSVTTQTMNGAAMPAQPDYFSGLIVNGSYDKENHLKIDTMISSTLNAELRSALKSTIEMIQGQIGFPKQPMKIGDKFEQTLPMKLPIGPGNTLEMKIITQFTLASIEAKAATFDMAIKATIDVASAQANISASGTGKGVAIYDIPNNLMSSNKSDMDMIMNMEMDGLIMMMNITTTSDQSITIKK